MNASTNIRRAADWVRSADAILIAAGAGMSVDSGLPDFRGTGGLWTALLPAGMTERDVGSLTQANCFLDKPLAAWQFYGRALQVCRQCTPHAGYALLKRWAARAAHGAFVFTSNVDGHFQAAGYDESSVLECHGTLNFLQCGSPCSNRIWASDKLMDGVDIEALSPAGLPRCMQCGELAPPNFLLFDDSHWVAQRTSTQWERLSIWLRTVQRPVVIEIGAGTVVPSVRIFAESVRGPLIRINLDNSDVAGQGVGLTGIALEVLSAIDAALG